MRKLMIVEKNPYVSVAFNTEIDESVSKIVCGKAPAIGGYNLLKYALCSLGNL